MSAGHERLSHAGRMGEAHASFRGLARSLSASPPHSLSRRAIIAFIGDISFCFLGALAGFKAGNSTSGSLGLIWSHWRAFAAWMAIIPLCLYYFDGYSTARMSNRLTMALCVLKAGIIGALIFAATIFLLSSDKISKSACLVIVCYSLCFLVLWRILLAGVLTRFIARRRVMVLGAGWAGSTITRELIQRSEEYQVVGLYDDDPAKLGRDVHGAQVTGSVKEAVETVRQGDIDLCVVAITHTIGADVHRVLQKLSMMGIPIVPMTDLYEFLTERVPVDHWGEHWFVNISYTCGDPVLLLGKRIFDVLFALGAIVVTLPAWILIAIIIRLTSPGPVFYRQDRVGFNGRIFSIWKFRSMFQDAESKSGAVWAQKEDPRITPVGRVLRRTRLDELPQLINIMLGDMSVVGPRPERPEFVNRFEVEIPFYRMRLTVRPGLTGWAQVLHKYDESMEDVQRKLQYDLFYVKHLSPFLDLRILIRTVAIILTGKGVK